MIPNTVSKALVTQMNMEFQAFYKYLAISSFCESKSLIGFAKWFAKQSEEERQHAMKIYRYLLDQDAQIDFLPLTQPSANFNSITHAIEVALENEKKVTASINEITGLATKENDFATASFLKWFIDEQVEEEATVKTMLDRVKMVEKSGEGILMLDREFGNGNQHSMSMGSDED